MDGKPTYEELERKIQEFEQAESEHLQTEKALKKQIMELTQPITGDENIAFEDLFNINDIQRLQDEFAKATNVASIITHTDGTPITAPSNFCRLCKDIIRKTDKGLANCFKSDEMIGRFHPEGPIVQPCMSGGLWDAGAGITVGGRHIANWLIGQVRDETQTEEKMLEYAREIGANEKDVVEAFRKVSAMSREQFEQVAKALFTLANQLSTLAYQNVQQARNITERKQAEETIKRSESLQSKMVANIGDVIVIIDQDGINKYKSPNIEKLFGWEPEEVVGHSAWDNVHPEDIKSTQKFVEALLLEPNAVGTIECRYKSKDGNYRWIEFTGSNLLHDPDIRGLLGNYHDITDRKHTEQSLRISEEKYRLIVENSHDGIITINDNSQFEYVNNEFSKITGRLKDELIGENFQSVLDEDSKILVTDRYRRRQKGEKVPPSYEFNILRPNGEKRRVEIHSTVINDNRGRIISIAQMLDITDKKLAEKAKQESEQKFRMILDKSDIGYYEVDIAGTFTFVSDALGEIFEEKTENLKGLGYKEYTSAATAKRLFAIYNNIFLTGNPTNRFEYQVNVKNNKCKTIETSVALIKDQDGKPVGFSGLVRDVTETKHLQNQLMQSQKMEAIGTLAGGIAHDFNNILGAILGYAQLAQLNLSENPKVLKYIDQLCMASERAKRLVQQILSFSRQSKSEKKPIDIGVIIQEALKLLRASIPSTIEINQNVKSNLGTVEADQTQIHQIVMNLCTNAFNAMEKQGGQLEVDLTPVEISTGDSSVFQGIKPGQYLRLTVTDTGPGMDNETITRIFEPYFTTKERGEGTGMGLATVHRIIKNHGGDIKVYSEPGTGTSFYILFPLIEGEAVKIAEESGSLPMGNEQILFVDDEKFLVDIGKESLESLGYNVEIRTSSYDALEAFRIHPDKYDMIITDMTMPKMTGERLAGEIKQIRPDIPIIVCTGFSMMITPENTKELGISSILMKPLTLNELAITVRRVLDEKME